MIGVELFLGSLTLKTARALQSQQGRVSCFSPCAQRARRCPHRLVHMAGDCCVAGRPTTPAAEVQCAQYKTATRATSRFYRL